MGARGCLIWRMPCQRSSPDDSGHLAVFGSVRAGGDYTISLEAKSYVQNIDEKVKARLTTWLVDQRNAGVRMPLVTIDIIKSVTNSQALLVNERAKRLLDCFVRETQSIGQSVHIELPPHRVSGLTLNMIPEATRRLWECLAWTESTTVQELEALLDFLSRKGWLNWERHDTTIPDYVTVTVEGHQQHETYQQRIGQVDIESPRLTEAHPQSDRTTDTAELEGNRTANIMKRNRTAFVSYSWDDEKHKSWVRELAGRLRQDGVDVKIDQWETVPGDQLTEFMERGVRDHDFVMIICTPKYKERSDSRSGGVGYEGDIMTAEVAQTGNHRKFIPILRSGTWENAAASWLKGKYYLDLRGESYGEDAYQELLQTLQGKLPTAPPVGRPTSKESGAE